MLPPPASMFTSPKNCNPLYGDRLLCPGGGAFVKTTCGPKVKGLRAARDEQRHVLLGIARIA